MEETEIPEAYDYPLQAGNTTIGCSPFLKRVQTERTHTKGASATMDTGQSI